ncbi:MAG: stage III sporulation protein AD [Oscillospiraceae bacterium]|jgi:stage III sporulation protein AD|nr:stage III sporulation protein AD [Oscillospiraceae bacterium]
MNIFLIAGLAMIYAVAIIALKERSPEYALVMSIALCCIIFLICIPWISKLVGEIKFLFERVNLPYEYSDIIFKCIGISLISQTASDNCKDAGQNALASKIESAGKIAIGIIALPLFDKVINLICTLFM